MCPLRPLMQQAYSLRHGQIGISPAMAPALRALGPLFFSPPFSAILFCVLFCAFPMRADARLFFMRSTRVPAITARPWRRQGVANIATHETQRVMDPPKDHMKQENPAHRKRNHYVRIHSHAYTDRRHAHVRRQGHRPDCHACNHRVLPCVPCHHQST